MPGWPREREYQERTEAIKARTELERQGLVLAPKPTFRHPVLPQDLADMTDDEMMRLFVRMTRWTDYLNGQLALAFVEERAAEAVHATAEAMALVGNYGGKDDSVNVAKAQRDLDPQVQLAADEVQVRYARRKLIETMFNSAERDSAVVSRELTRRVGRMETNDRRVSRWQS